MKRFLTTIGILVILLGVPASHFAFSGAKPCPKGKNKGYLCHIIGSEKGVGGPVKRTKGQLLYTSVNAIEHHMAHHRDCMGDDIIKIGKKNCACDNCTKTCEDAYDTCIANCGSSNGSCKGKCNKDRAKCKTNCNKK